MTLIPAGHSLTLIFNQNVRSALVGTSERSHGEPSTASTIRLSAADPPVACWAGHDGELPVIEGSPLGLQVQHLPGGRDPKPVWLWSSLTDAGTTDMDRWWQLFLRHAPVGAENRVMASEQRLRERQPCGHDPPQALHDRPLWPSDSST